MLFLFLLSVAHKQTGTDYESVSALLSVSKQRMYVPRTYDLKFVNIKIFFFSMGLFDVKQNTDFV